MVSGGAPPDRSAPPAAAPAGSAAPSSPAGALAGSEASSPRSPAGGVTVTESSAAWQADTAARGASPPLVLITHSARTRRRAPDGVPQARARPLVRVPVDRPRQSRRAA